MHARPYVRVYVFVRVIRRDWEIKREVKRKWCVCVCVWNRMTGRKERRNENEEMTNDAKKRLGRESRWSEGWFTDRDRESRRATRVEG